ncbi:MAG: biopolymer transporter ExbD [Pseudomonadota bacterium]
MSITSLIDVIFLLLLFFMLSSTLTKFSEIEMGLGGAGNQATAPEHLAFLRLGEERLQLNGKEIELSDLVGRIDALEGPTLVVSVLPSASAQRLTDLLVMLRAVPEIQTVLLEDR